MHKFELRIRHEVIAGDGQQRKVVSMVVTRSRLQPKEKQSITFFARNFLYIYIYRLQSLSHVVNGVVHAKEKIPARIFIVPIFRQCAAQ